MAQLMHRDINSEKIVNIGRVLNLVHVAINIVFFEVVALSTVGFGIKLWALSYYKNLPISLKMEYIIAAKTQMHSNLFFQEALKSIGDPVDHEVASGLLYFSAHVGDFIQKNNMISLITTVSLLVFLFVICFELLYYKKPKMIPPSGRRDP